MTRPRLDAAARAAVATICAALFTVCAPAARPASSTARFSTSVMPLGTAINTRGFVYWQRNILFGHTEEIKCLSIASVTSKSAITPDFMGRIATMLPGVRPSISLAFNPTARTLLEPFSIATTLGSLKTMPRPFM